MFDLRSIAWAAAYGVIFSMPASAYMPSPYDADWIDHTKSFWIGADAADQVFATGTVTPTGGGHFRYHLKCEHNETRNAVAVYTLEFFAHGKVLYFHTKVCSLGGTDSNSMGYIPMGNLGVYSPESDYDLNLFTDLDQIDHIRFTAHLGPGGFK